MATSIVICVALIMTTYLSFLSNTVGKTDLVLYFAQGFQ